MRITPLQTSYRRDGPPPGFAIETGGYGFFAVQVTSEAVLLNGANAARRTPQNFFDSWSGDALFPPRLRPAQAPVAGAHLEAPTGRAQYTLPAPVWARLRRADRLFYRLIVAADARRRRFQVSVADVDWARAPSLAIGQLPAQPVQGPTARFRGRGALARPDFIAQAAQQVALRGLVSGRDGDLRFVLLDARRFDMTVLECHRWGLTDTVAKLPRKPDAVVNGQFIAGAFGVATEGQVVREGALINAGSYPQRQYLAQTWGGAGVESFRVGQGNPRAREPGARAAFGGLGPVLLGGAPPATLTPWARSIYALPRGTGRGAIAIRRDLQLIALVVQEHSSFFPTNALTMAELRDMLLRMGFDDAVFNDGSDSEALYARGGWLLEPGAAKDEAMDFAIAFVERGRNRRLRLLAIDGTTSRDGEAMVSGLARPPITHYAPDNLADDLSALPALAGIAGAFRSGVLQSYRATSEPQLQQIRRIVELGGSGGHWADLLYLSSHAWRHGQLYQHDGGGERGPIRVLADPWSPAFRPVWRSTPRWLIIAGCAVLGLRYSRGLALNATERGHLVDWHRAIHGAGATVPGLAPGTRVLFAVYHPGWAWYARVFRHSPALRGVLGYWYRSPGRGRDVPIIEEFAAKLCEGATLLEAWEEANRRGFFEAEAAWAAMVREGCAGDTLAALEDPAPPPVRGEFRYYDRFQRGRALPDAYREANLRPEVERVGGVSLRHNPDYDRLALGQLAELPVAPTPANFLAYSDGVGP